MERSEIAAEKARLRVRFHARRASLSHETRDRASAAIRDRLEALVTARAAQSVSAFWPLAEEPDLRPLLLSLHARGVRVLLPVVASAPGAPPELEHRRFTGEHALVKGRFGVREPLAGDLVAPEAVNLALVPALAVDPAGGRLGYGGGFYDTFLAQTPALRVGVLFGIGRAETLPAEPHDEGLDAIATEASLDWTHARGA